MKTLTKCLENIADAAERIPYSTFTDRYGQTAAAKLEIKEEVKEALALLRK